MDTGCSNTGIAQAIIDEAGLEKVEEGHMLFSTDLLPVSYYRCALVIGVWRAEVLVFSDPPREKWDGLLGRDFLSFGTLYWNGPSGECRLRFPGITID